MFNLGIKENDTIVQYKHRQNLQYESRNQIQIITSLASHALTRGGSG